jgi:hypothetical protein
MTTTLKSLDLKDEPSAFQDEFAYEQKNYNWAQLRSYAPYLVSFITNSFADYDVRINNLLSGVSQPEEVVDARISSDGTTYATLKAHLDNIEETKTSYVDGTELDDVAQTIRLTDLSATSSPIHIASSVVLSTTNTDTGEGLVIMPTASLSITEGDAIG